MGETMTGLRISRWTLIVVFVTSLALAGRWVHGQNKLPDQKRKGFEVPPAPALSPQDEMKTFQIVPGYRIELVAAEPLVHDPVAMTFDPDGRSWVCQMRGFMTDVAAKGENGPVSTISGL